MHKFLNLFCLFQSRIVISGGKTFLFNKPLSEDVGNFAFMTSLTDVIYRNQQSHKEFVLQTCKEQLMTVNIVMFFQKNSYIKDAFDKKLSGLFTGGIIQYWVQNFADPRFLKVKIRSSEQQKLSIEKLSGVFNIWLIGLAVAILFFLFEFSIAKIKKALSLK